ncbi:pyridoxamine 5'-phosphate oxidase family protein [Rhodococcus fascians]|nr:pyridoxamine 5'-phosphate oxidase family protein [Rhodococcus fascians]MBY4114723.1 pyridoxamine 5'-phosphate oxidase family protein [Rhodococcus fascians]
MQNIDTKTIARTGRGTVSEKDSSGSAEWSDITAKLRSGQATSWLSVRRSRGGVHTRPVFAAFGDMSFFFATKGSAAKTAHLHDDNEVSLAIDLDEMHLVVDGVAERLTTPDDLHHASAVLLDVFDWPTQVRGDELDAPYAAPTSGGPPFQAWELRPTQSWAFPTRDQFEPTKFIFRAS